MAEVPLNPNNNKPLSIALSFHLKDVVEINEPQVGCFKYFISACVKTNKNLCFQMYFSLKFNIWLGWSDNRLEYHNLNKHYHENAISREFARSLWKPEIVFENNLKRRTLR